MSDLAFVALATYGRDLSTDSGTHQRVPTLKCTPIAAEILLTVYGHLARQLPHRPGQSYRYVALSPMPSLKSGLLVLRLTAEEVSRIEQVTRQTVYSWTYRWRDSRWWEFPTVNAPDYREVKSASSSLVPRFPPTAAPFVTVSHLIAERAETGGAVQPLHVEQSDGWWWIAGDTYPMRDQLRAAGARWSKKRRQWYFIGAVLPASIQTLIQPASPPLPTEKPAMLEATPPLPSVVAQPEEEAQPNKDKEQVRIIPPPSVESDDPMLQAVAALSADQLATPSMPLLRGRTGSSTCIPHRYCGELTGAISGAVYCYGYAVHAGICVYLNMGGPRMSVEAIRARLSKGDAVNLLPPDGAAMELTAGEGNTGRYTAYLQNIPAAKFTSAILVHERMIQPDYGGDSWTCIAQTSEAQAMAKLKQHITELVSVPIFEAWTAYLWEAGQRAGLVTTAVGGGGLPMICVTLDSGSWSRLIAAGLAHKKILLPTTVSNANDVAPVGA